jgi:uncharacterized membrane protein YkvA (DUF1232 family)
MRFIGIGQTLFRYWKMANDPRTPKFVKFMIVGGVGFTLIPEKWLPEWMPEMGFKNDTAIIPSVIALSMLMIPNEVKRDHERQAREDALAKQAHTTPTRIAAING